MIELVILLCLILINGLLVMSEISLISARKGRLEGTAARGDTRSKTALKLQEKPEVFLSTAQIFITLISILTGVYSGERFGGYLKPYIEKIDWFRPYAGTIATVIIVILVTFLSSIFGELLPKRIAMLRPEKIAKAVAKPMQMLSRIAFPIVWLLTNVTTGIFKLLNIKESTDNSVTEDEIKAMISEGSEHGTIEEDEKEIIERVFHLGDRNITSLMTHRTDIVWFDMLESNESIRGKIKEYLHSVYPLCEGDIDNIKGVVYVKDMYLQPDAPLTDLCKKALIVPENNTAYQLLEKFKETKIHYAFIVDEYGTMNGMVTINDILKAIVGEMPEDEDDDYAIVERKDGSFLVDAQIQFYDFLMHFDRAEWMNQEEHDFDTLAGFILHELKRIPHVGETFEWRGFEFEIMDMDSHRIDKVMVKITEELQEEMDEE
ncbi:MAG: HlyC/CorC family transporter [Chitinophagaceae bacterium]|nr:HlyC/CorC family transporter [Chitinophagaceae bacterium]